jgi:putative tryptophan/tyrosine transport system substrate-binding protein
VNLSSTLTRSRSTLGSKLPLEALMILRALCAVLLIPACVLAEDAGTLGRPYRVGLVANSIPLAQWSAPSLEDGSPHPGQAIREGLGRLGWIDGKNIHIVWRSAEGRYERLPAIFRELADLPVDVMVAIGPGTSVAAQATRTVPVVMAVSAAALGPFTQSLSRPDRNLTGLTFEAGELEGKRLEILKRAVPKAIRIAILEEELGCTSPSKTLENAAAALGLTLLRIPFASLEQLERAFERAVDARADAVLVCDGVLVWRYRYQRSINALALRHRLPTMHTAAGGADNGGLMAYGIDMMVQYRRVPYYIDRILRGAKPSELPIEQPRAVELVVNLRTARALGLDIPAALRVQADRVIE